MNIIEKVREILSDFPKIARICGTVHVDFTGADDNSYGLASLGDMLVSEDILGNQTRQHTFMLHSVFSAVNDYERLTNSGVLLELAQFLDRCSGDEVTHETGGVIHKGEITKITTSNGMLSAIPDENTVTGWFYQLMINAEYTVWELKYLHKNRDLIEIRSKEEQAAIDETEAFVKELLHED